MGRKNNKSSKNTIENSKPSNLSHESNCYEGIRLANLLNSIEREIDFEKLSNKALPEKLWFKQQFSIGVNDVTRVLERMKPIVGMGGDSSMSLDPGNAKGSSIQLQAILLASDCHPRWLTKHLPNLALSRKVPLIFIKDNKGGSLRLGKLVKLKTAIAIGVKVKGNTINQIIEEILREHTSNFEATA